MRSVSPERAVPLILMASYLYYCHDVSLMPDEAFDKLCKLALKHLEELKHPHEFLLSRDGLEAGSLYHLRDDDYPPSTRMAAVRCYLEDLARKQGAKKKQVDARVTTTLVMRVVDRNLPLSTAVELITNNQEA